MLASSSWPKWTELGFAELGQREIRGNRDNPRIVEYLTTTRGNWEHDETPWCSAFVNWCVRESGLEGTNSAAARSWLKWGKELPVPILGCVTVLWRGSKHSHKGHVGFYICHSQDKKQILLLGGNQGNAVSLKWYDAHRLLSYRWV